MSDPATYYFTQGVLGVTVIVLGLVIRALYSELKKEREEKFALLEAWLTETKEEGKIAVDALKNSSQSLIFLADKIEAGKKGS